MDVCTIITAGYLPYARVLMESYRKHNTGGRFFVLLLDKTEKDIRITDPSMTAVNAEDLPLPDLHRLQMKYDAYELSMALRPWFLLHLFEHFDVKDIVQLDADILVTGPLKKTRDLLTSHDVILTPHYFTPLPEDGHHPNDQLVLASGTYNGGFFACRNTPETKRALEWLAQRLLTYSYHRPEQCMFGDQKWLDFFPSMVERTHVLHDTSYNLAFWNLHERTITKDGERYFVNGEPMTCFHFSGFKPQHPSLLSVHQNRYRLDANSALATLLSDYASRLQSAGHGMVTAKYAYDFFSNGVRICPVIRAIFEETGGYRFYPAPFDCESYSFFAWLMEPASRSIDGGHLTNLHVQLHRLSIEATGRFPWPTGSDMLPFATWLLAPEQRERMRLDDLFIESLHPLALQTPTQGFAQGIRSLPSRRHTFGPYQFACRLLRRAIGNARYDELRPRKSILKEADNFLFARPKKHALLATRKVIS